MLRSSSWLFYLKRKTAKLFLQTILTILLNCFSPASILQAENELRLSQSEFDRQVRGWKGGEVEKVFKLLGNKSEQIQGKKETNIYYLLEQISRVQV